MFYFRGERGFAGRKGLPGLPGDTVITLTDVKGERGIPGEIGPPGNYICRSFHFLNIIIFRPQRSKRS